MLCGDSAVLPVQVRAALTVSVFQSLFTSGLSQGRIGVAPMQCKSSGQLISLADNSMHHLA